MRTFNCFSWIQYGVSYITPRHVRKLMAELADLNAMPLHKHRLGPLVLVGLRFNYDTTVYGKRRFLSLHFSSYHSRIPLFKETFKVLGSAFCILMSGSCCKKAVSSWVYFRNSLLLLHSSKPDRFTVYFHSLHSVPRMIFEIQT